MPPDIIDGLPLYRYDLPGGPVLYFREELTPARWEEWQRSYRGGELQLVEDGGELVKVEAVK